MLLDLTFPVDLPLPVDSQFSVNPRRSTIFVLPQHKGILRSRHHNGTDFIL